MRVRDTWLLDGHYFDEPSDWRFRRTCNAPFGTSLRRSRLLAPFSTIPRPPGIGPSDEAGHLERDPRGAGLRARVYPMSSRSAGPSLRPRSRKER